MTNFNKNKIWQTIIFLFLIIFFKVENLKSQVLGIGYQTVIKTEYQYSDYFKYSYPDPILYEYPDVLYTQPLPYISAFPEHRFLTRITQYLGFKTSLWFRYQRSHLDKNIHQNIYNARFNYEINDQYSVMATYQFMEFKDKREAGNNYSGHMFEVGGKFNFAGAVQIESSYGYYTSSYVTSDTEQGGAHSIMLKLRQALRSTTALQVKYNYFVINYSSLEEKEERFHSNTLTVWLSQYLPIETALHLSNRFYWNSSKTNSFSPSCEVIQYLNWKTILHLDYRYYHNKPQEEVFLQRIKGDTFSTHSWSVILEYSFTVNTKIWLKYRYYTSDQDVSMNTYLIALEQIF